MDDLDLDRLEALAKAVIDDTDASKWWTVSSLAPLLTAEAKASTAEIDAAFVAAASPDVVLRLVAELREARATIARVAAKLGVDFDGAQSSEPLEDSIDEMIDSAAELSEARAEIERLRAMVPSEDEAAEITDEVFNADVLLHEDGGLPRTKVWLARIESAKGDTQT